MRTSARRSEHSCQGFEEAGAGQWWRGVGVAGLICAIVAGAPKAASAQDLYDELNGRGLLDSYLEDTIEEVLADVVDSDGSWCEGSVNTRASSDTLPVLIVDAERMKNEDLPISFRIRNGAYADTRTGYILLDGNVLRRWAVAATSYANDFSSIDSAILIETRSMESLRSLWDPQRNPALTSRDISVGPREFLTGAIAFTLAHEMNHLQTGIDVIGNLPEPPELSGRAAQLRWACAALIDPRFTQFRRLESDADEHAANVLARIPMTAQGAAPRFKYEFGAYWLGLHMMGRTVAGIAMTTNDAFLRAAVAQQANPTLVAELFEQSRDEHKKEDLVSMVFHDSHPSDVDRLLEVSKRLRNRPGSTFYNSPESSGSMEMMMWGLVKGQICDEARDRKR